MKYDVIIIGAGPAGIFTALEVIRHKPDQKILMVEKGKPVDKRHCPKAETGKCMNCKPNCMTLPDSRCRRILRWKVESFL